MPDAVKDMTKEDVPYLYWTGASWMGAYSINAFDINLSVGVQKAVVLMNKALELYETFNNGAIHDFFIAFYASMPQGMGGNDDKARLHFERTVAISKGLSASPYVSLATSLDIKTQNADEFKKLMNQALAIDPNQDITNRLANIISQKKAKWYLEHMDDFFVE
jgi:predicted anti-sigma-YlaC factor YlaD